MKRLVLSIDVEDWFCVRNMSQLIPYETWDGQEHRIDQGMCFLLDELKKRNIKATFFVLGWLAERRGDLVKAILADGHELASHGHNHQGLDTMTEEEIREDIAKSQKVLSLLAGGKLVKGYRAPSFSITKKTWSAFKVLQSLGFKYDSSIYPIRHPDYGVSDFGQEPREIHGVWEFPLNFIKYLGLRIPISGGGYFRLFPYFLYKIWLKRALKERDIILYFHPWEFDPKQPLQKLPLLKKFRHYVGLKRNQVKFSKLLDDFKFTTMETLLEERI